MADRGERRTPGRAEQPDEDHQQQARRYSALLEATGAAVVTFDTEGHVKTWDASAERTFGYIAEELIGKRASDVLLPDLQEEQIALFQRVQQSGEAAVIETERPTKDGRRLQLEITLKAFTSGTGETEILALVSDISQRKQAERQLKFTQFTVDQAEMAVFWCYASGRFFYVNDTACRWLGYSRAELKRMHVADINPELPIEAWPARWQEIREKGMVRIESVHQRKNGEIYPVEIHSNCVEFEGERYELAFVNDISDRRRAEQAQAELEAQLRQSQKMEAVGQLAGGIAHDFNNLLHVISGHADLALAELDANSPARDDLEAVLKAGDNAAALVGQLLAFSRRQLMKPAPLSFNAVIDEALQMLRRVLGEQIKLAFVPDDYAPAVAGDRGMLSQVVMNLCVNGRDAMPDGGTLAVETHNVVTDDAFCRTHAWARPGRYAMLAVADSGSGMSPSTKERAFEPFFTTKGKGKGSGLGLATVYGIVQQHGGMIEIHSELGRGSRFEVYIPGLEQATIEHSSEPAEGLAAGGHETILLAEDDEAVRRLNRRVLEQAGYRVLLARDGGQAVRRFKQLGGEVDLLLFDVVMPEMGGLQAARAIHAESPQVPALFITGYSEDAVHANFVLKEGLPLLQKPHSSQALLRAVRGVLDAD